MSWRPNSSWIRSRCGNGPPAPSVPRRATSTAAASSSGAGVRLLRCTTTLAGCAEVIASVRVCLPTTGRSAVTPCASSPAKLPLPTLPCTVLATLVDVGHQLKRRVHRRPGTELTGASGHPLGRDLALVSRYDRVLLAV